MSFPAAFGSLVLAEKHAVVVAGTHGKTTTSALMAHVLVAAGRDASFLVGGVTLDYGGNFRLGQGEHVVVEGDEYDTAYFDKGPKFLHYRARTAILTSVEFDHADIYRDMPHYESAFAKFAATIPQDGTLAVCAMYPNAVKIARAHCRGRVVTYVGQGLADYRATHITFGEDGAHFEVAGPDGSSGAMHLTMTGFHNVENAVGVYVAARALGLTAEEVNRGFSTFKGVKRRQEVRGTPGGVIVIDDFAHHPTAVRETIVAIRQRYPERRIWAVFEPRSNTSRRNIHQEEYARAFDHANVAVLRYPEHHDQVPLEQELSVPRIVEELGQKKIEAFGSPSVEELIDHVARGARHGDVVLVMSNGAFGGFIPELMKRLGG